MAEAIVPRRVEDTLLHGDFVACLRHAVPRTVREPHTAACRPYVGLLRWRASSTLGSAVHSRHRLIRSMNVGTSGHLPAKWELRLAREQGDGRGRVSCEARLIPASAFPCEHEIPFATPALARHRLTRQPTTALASHFLRLSAKRNGGGASVISRVDDSAITVSIVITDGGIVS